MAIRTCRHEDGFAESHEINVTPFIDVMLVLLIVFMVAAPLATVEVPVELPAAKAEPMSAEKPPAILTVTADLSLRLNEDPLSRAELASALQALSGGDQQMRVFLRADKQVPYGELMAVMEMLRDAGYLQVALVAAEKTGREQG